MGLCWSAFAGNDPVLENLTRTRKQKRIAETRRLLTDRDRLVSILNSYAT